MLNILSAPQSDKIPPNLPIPRSMNGNTASQNLLTTYYPKILKHTTQVKKKSLHQSNFWKWLLELWKGRFYIECFSKLFRIAEKVNYEGQVRHERREETNEQQAPCIKQKSENISFRIFLNIVRGWYHGKMHPNTLKMGSQGLCINHVKKFQKILFWQFIFTKGNFARQYFYAGPMLWRFYREGGWKTETKKKKNRNTRQSEISVDGIRLNHPHRCCYDNFH